MGLDLETKKGGKLSLFSATLIGITCIIGSGWLFAPQINAQQVGNWSFLVLIGGAILALLVGVCFIPITRRFPIRGITARAVSLSHHNIFGMPFAFVNWFGILAVIPTEAQATVQYLSGACHWTSLVTSDGHFTSLGKVASLVVMFLYLLINYFGAKLLARLNNPVTILKIFTPIFVIVIILVSHFDKSNFTLYPHFLSNAPGIQGYLLAFITTGAVYCFNGFQTPLSFASEVKNPKVNLPLALFLAILCSLVIFLFLQMAFMGGVPHALLLDKGWAGINFASPMVTLTSLLGLNFVTLLLLADAVISPSGTGYTYMGSTSRMFYGMAQEGQVPKFLVSKPHPIFNVSRRSLIVNFIIAAVVLCFSNSWQTLMIFVATCEILGYLAGPISAGIYSVGWRIIGCIVFIFVMLIFSLLPIDNIYITTGIVTVLMAVYIFMQWRVGSVSILPLLGMGLPFVIFLIVITFTAHHSLINAIEALVFYVLVTSQRFVVFCNQHRQTNRDQILAEEVVS